jgi:cell division transport system permease protein
MRAFRYFIDEAVASLWRGYKTACIAMATIAAAFFVLGGFLIVTANMERLFARWQEAAEFSVYLRDASTDNERAAVERALHESSLVKAVEVISKEEALRRFKQNFAALAQTTSDMADNPLPASIEVRLAPDADPAQVGELAGKITALSGVADVRYDRQWIQRLMTAVRLVRTGGFSLAVVLVCAAALTVASVVRLTLMARRDEIHIMQLVGAPLAYIRGPFLAEGVIQGGLGALLALVLLWGAFVFVRSRLGPVVEAAIDPSTITFLPFSTSATLLAGGMLVGCVGGVIAARSAREIAD